MTFKIAGIMAVVGLISLPALADMFTPSHACSKPFKPYQFNSQWELDRFNNDVQSYRRCITDFVEEQNDEADRHRNAANDAIDEWNFFLEYELN
ncbi:hypothetical protein [uncultured Umboniibacter sp.]|uniref:hypothetical protein n=1 Tax=uncultured Umboniibacter sp. TaxID=1798917 RepID=UPI002631C47F|nr:hypothetical protein [uncultured Umboniibacter sp.]